MPKKLRSSKATLKFKQQWPFAIAGFTANSQTLQHIDLLASLPIVKHCSKFICWNHANDQEMPQIRPQPSQEKIHLRLSLQQIYLRTSLQQFLF